MKFVVRMLLAVVALGMTLPAARAETVTETIHLINGQDLSPFYTFLKGIGRDKDPNKVFTIEDGMLRITGEDWGCVTTHKEYENYRLVAEFKWGERTWGNRTHAARDGGILVHSKGEDGGYSGIWMHSIEIQIIEGGTGDLLVVGDGSEDFAITVESAEEKQGSCFVFKEGGEPATIHSGRINWWGRDPGWDDVINFRGAQDVEHPVGEWNTIEAIVDGDRVEVFLNGVLVNRATGVRPSKGRIQLQSEGAEMWFRKLDLHPLEKNRK